MPITLIEHAKQRMSERGITYTNIVETLKRPVEAINTKHSRQISFTQTASKYLVVIYEMINDTVKVISTYWADKRRPTRLGFTRV